MTDCVAAERRQKYRVAAAERAGKGTPPPMIPTRPGWQQQAACRGMDPDLFFPTGRTGEAVSDLALAREVCAGCPVAADCLEYALTARPAIQHGIWAGRTDRQLERMRADRARRAS